MKRAQASVSCTVPRAGNELTGAIGSCTAQRPEADRMLPPVKGGPVPGSRLKKLREFLDEAKSRLRPKQTDIVSALKTQRFSQRIAATVG